MSTSQSLYADPMVYDILHTPGTAREVTAYEKIEALFASKPLSKNRLWFEPACGTGRYLRVASGRGRQIAGFDWDSGQIEYAKKRMKRFGETQLAQEFFQGDMKDFTDEALIAGYAANSADFSFNPVNSIRLLETDQDMLDHFNQMAEILKPGSIYVVGISLTDYSWLFPEEDLWEGTRGRCKVSQLINFIPPDPGTEMDRIEMAISHLTVTRPSREEHFDDRYGLRTYDKNQWLKLIGQSNLKHGGSYDAWAIPLGQRILPYQMEVLLA